MVTIGNIQTNSERKFDVRIYNNIRSWWNWVCCLKQMFALSGNFLSDSLSIFDNKYIFITVYNNYYSS